MKTIDRVTVMIRSMGRSSLPATLDSVAQQSWPNIDVLIINASGQPHPAVPDFCGPHPISLVEPNTALSRSEAGNLALQTATGDAWLFLDDDDVIFPSHIQKLASTLQQAPEQAVMVYTGVEAIDDQGTVISSFTYHVPKERLFLSNYIPIHAALFRAEVVQSNQCCLDESLDIYEDWDFWLQLSQYGNFIYTPGISAQYKIQHTTDHPVHTPAKIEQAALCIYRKWKDAWPIEGLGVLREYVQNQERLNSNLNKEQSRQQLKAQLNEMRTTLEIHQQQLKEVTALKDQAQCALAATLNSRSWRLTRPLRAFTHQCHQLKKYFFR